MATLFQPVIQTFANISVLFCFFLIIHDSIYISIFFLAVKLKRDCWLEFLLEKFIYAGNLNFNDHYFIDFGNKKLKSHVAVLTHFDCPFEWFYNACINLKIKIDVP